MSARLGKKDVETKNDSERSLSNFRNVSVVRFALHCSAVFAISNLLGHVREVCFLTFGRSFAKSMEKAKCGIIFSFCCCSSSLPSPILPSSLSGHPFLLLLSSPFVLFLLFVLVLQQTKESTTFLAFPPWFTV